jgi:hypothetical protein
MNPSITRRSIVLFLLAGLIGLTAFIAFYDKAFPGASIDLKLSREQAISRSRDFLQGRGFTLTGYKPVAVFGEQRREIDFLERNLGLARANELFRTTVAVWRWKVRWFKELEETEYSVQYTPDGRFAAFSRTIPESAPGPRFDEARARQVAEEFLSRTAGADLRKYRYIERSTEDLPQRLDQTPVWRHEGLERVKGSEYRVSVDLQGDRVAGFSQWLHIPESWIVAQKEVSGRRNLLSQFSYFPISILYLSIIAVFFWRAHAGGIRWRWSIAVAAVASVVVFLSELNNLSFAVLSYETTQSIKAFWGDHFSSLVLASILSVLFFVPLFASSDVLGRLYFPDRPWSTSVFSRSYLGSGEALRQMVLGYGMAFAAVGYVTLFYVGGRSFFGVWSPVEVEMSNSFSTYFPSFSEIYTGLSAALTEELMFRLSATALVYRFTKRFWPAVIIPAIIWGFGHTTYPQQPIWIRGVELSIAGIVYGFVFLKYGLLTTLVSHFVYDVFVGVTPHLQSGRPGLVLSALFALVLPLLVLGALRFFRPHQALRFLPGFARPPISAGGAVHPAAIGEDGLAPGTNRGVWWRTWLLAAGAAVVFCLSLLVPTWDFFGSPPPVKLTERQAIALCDKARSEIGFGSMGYRSYTVYNDDTERLPDYVIDLFWYWADSAPLQHVLPVQPLLDYPVV